MYIQIQYQIVKFEDYDRDWIVEISLDDYLPSFPLDSPMGRLLFCQRTRNTLAEIAQEQVNLGGKTWPNGFFSFLAPVSTGSRVERDKLVSEVRGYLKGK
jgi:hypothetical protein